MVLSLVTGEKTDISFISISYLEIITSASPYLRLYPISTSQTRPPGQQATQAVDLAEDWETGGLGGRWVLAIDSAQTCKKEQI